MNLFHSLSIGLIIAIISNSITQPQEVDRKEFAANMRLITPGTEKEGVIRLIGHPDKVQKTKGVDQRKLEEIVVNTFAAEVWYYGTNDTSDLATLGLVLFDRKGAAITIVGEEGTPFESQNISEPELKECLRLVDSMPPCVCDEWDPLLVISIANKLIQKNQGEGQAIIREYARIVPPSERAYQRVALLLRVLYEAPAGSGYFPNVRFGESTSHMEPAGNTSLLPRFPVHLFRDIPILLAADYGYVGSPMWNGMEIVDWFEQNGVWRTKQYLTPNLSADEIAVLRNEILKLGEAYLDKQRILILEQLISPQLKKLSRKE